MTHLVVGGTGNLGGMIARRLLQRGERVRALVRPATDASSLEAAGAELALGDLKDADSLASACRGMRRIVSTATAAMRGGEDTVESVDRQGYTSLIKAAEKAGVDQFLFVSAHGFAPEAPLPLARAKGATAAALVASRLDHTVLEPSLFMESWVAFVLGSQLESGDRVSVVGDPERKYGFVSAVDVGELAVVCQGHPRAIRSVLPFSTEIASFGQIVRRIEEATGREIAVESTPPGTPIAHLPPAVNDLWTWLATGDEAAIATPETAAAFGIEPLSLQRFITGAFAAS